jgi:hypothetical protein
MFKILVTLITAVALQGCSSTPINVSPLPPAHFQKLGRVSGEGCWALAFGHPGYAIFPIALGSHVDRAYRNALAKAPGATALINVQYEDYWFWWALATSRCAKVSGEAIQEVSQ